MMSHSLDASWFQKYENRKKYFLEVMKYGTCVPLDELLNIYYPRYPHL